MNLLIEILYVTLVDHLEIEILPHLPLTVENLN